MKNIRSLASASLVALSLVACAAGSVDQGTCDSVRIGDTRADVERKLGDAESVTKGANGFAVARFKTTTDGVAKCCSVTLENDSDTALAVTAGRYEAKCK